MTETTDERMTDDEQTRLDDRERIIIAGSRSITDYELLRRIFIQDFAPPELAKPNYLIVSGGAEGVDTLGEQYAEKWDIPLTKFDADWSEYGKAAGPIRNRKMARFADTLIALWDGESDGTRDMIDTAVKYNLEVHVYQPAHLRGDD